MTTSLIVTPVKQQRLLNLLEDHLASRASTLLMARLRRVVEGLGTEPTNVEDGLKKIRVAVKLFVDEDLAEDLHREMRDVLRLVPS